MAKPNFLILGAMKAGTTSLYHYLGQHPQVYMSPKKEPHYFAYGDMPLPTETARYMSHIVQTRDAYDRLFAGASGRAAVGEASTSYLSSERAVGRIAEALPGVRLIAVLRQPAERAHSHFVFNHKRFFEIEPDFQKALDAEDARDAAGWGPRFHYRRKGYYAEQLSRYFAVFPRERVLVLLYDDLQRDAVGVVRRIYRFLEIDEGFEPDVSVRYNISGVSRNRAIDVALRTLHPVRRSLERALPAKFVSAVGRVLIQKPPPPSAIHARLTKHYRPDILKLQDLINRDLSHWLK